MNSPSPGGPPLSRSNHVRQKSNPPSQPATTLVKQVSAPSMNRQASHSSNSSTSSRHTALSSARPSPSPYSQRNQGPATVSTSSLTSASASTKPARQASYGLPPRVHSPVGDHADIQRHRARQHSQGFFEPTLPTTTSQYAQSPSMSNLSTSQIAAQAAMQVQGGPHARRRSQTVPDPLATNPPVAARMPSFNSSTQSSNSPSRASSQNRGGLQPGTTASNTTTAASAASAAYPRSPIPSPVLQQQEFAPSLAGSDKDLKPGKEKSRMKIFSKPKAINVSGTKDPDKKAFPSPKKPPGAFSAATLPRSLNHSTTSLVDPTASSASSIYSIPNTSTSTLTPTDSRATGEKEKHRHHFLSRQKLKLKDVAEHHNLSLSSAASNSRQTDPNMQPLYTFVPSSPAHSTTFNKSKTGLDLRHGGRALREKKREEKAAAGTFIPPLTTSMTTPTESTPRDRDGQLVGTPDFQSPGFSYFGPASSGTVSDNTTIQQSLANFGLQGMTLDDAWPLLRARLLIIFEGEEIRTRIEDFNRLVTAHLKRCIQQQSPGTIIQDLRDLIATGFKSLDQTLRRVPDPRLVPHLVDMWGLVFGTILPFTQAVFHPLDLELKGRGAILSPKEVAELRRSLPAIAPPTFESSPGTAGTRDPLDVRTLVLMAFRDAIILPRHDKLLSIFSRLSLDNINAMPPDRLESPPPLRPGTATSLASSGQGELPTTSFNSQGSTLLDSSTAGSLGARSRATSNTSAMSAGSFHSISSSRPHASSHGSSTAGSRAQVQQQVQVASQGGAAAVDSAHVTQTAARMLQCISILAGLQSGMSTSGAMEGEAIDGTEDVETLARKKLERLGKELKLNWLGRGRTGRNRRGLVGGKARNPVIGVTA